MGKRIPFPTPTGESALPLSAFRPQRQNANRHTARGHAALEQSIAQDGWIGAMTVAADGETFDGSDRLEVGVTQDHPAPIVVDSDGTRPVIVRRVDIPTAEDARAKRLGLAANRVAALNLDWAPDVLLALADADPALLAGLWREDELAALAGTATEIDPAALWQGMPEFAHEDKTAFQSITLHFVDQAAVEQFADLVGQKISPKTRFLWYPAIEIEHYADKRYAPEP